MKLLPLLLVLALVSAAAFCAEAKPLPVYHCRHIDKEINLTGKLNDPLWQKAETVELVDSATGIRKGYHTTARLLWSQRYLYVGFQCEDEYIWGTYTKRDEPLYNEEVVEIFVSPTGKVRQYYEVEVSPLNTILDTFVLNGKSEKNRRWDNYHSFMDYNIEGLLTQVNIDGELNKRGAGKGWTAEMAIPFTGLIGNDTMVPVAGDKWRFNLFRVDVPEPGNFGQFAWSPIMLPGDFHRPWRFGELVFEQK